MTLGLYGRAPPRAHPGPTPGPTPGLCGAIWDHGDGSVLSPCPISIARRSGRAALRGGVDYK
jgi:hypothetical protein